MIKIHDTAKISENCDIEDSVKGSVIEIGAFSNIDSFVKIKPAGGSGNIKLGKRVHINSCCVLYSGNGILIGNNVLVAANCTFAPVNHEYKNTTLKICWLRIFYVYGKDQNKNSLYPSLLDLCIK